MNKWEFLKALEEGLAEASSEERAAAMQYYGEYLDEAGPEREAEAIQELGSPQKLAQDVIAASGAMTPSPWAPPRLETGGWADGPKNALRPLAPPPAKFSAGYNERNNRLAKIVLLVLVGIFIIPTVFGGLGSVFIGIVAVLASVFFVPAVLGAALLAAGALFIVAGILLLPAAVGSGLVCIGSGLLLLGGGAFCLRGGIRLLGKVLPKVVRGGASLIAALWHKISGAITGATR